MSLSFSFASTLLSTRHALAAPSALAVIALALGACGGPMIQETTSARLDDEEDERIVPERDDDEPEEPDGIDSGLVVGDDAPITLSPRREVPGTGVSLQAPEGAQPMPFAAGFIDVRRRLQISVVVAEGPPEILESFRHGAGGDGPRPEAVGQEEAVQISQVEGRLGRDRIDTGDAQLERTWVLAHDAERQRGMAVVATYEAGRAMSVRRMVAASLRTAEWDPSTTIDASEALGITLGAIEGLELNRGSTSSLVMVQPGTTMPPDTRAPAVMAAPLPMRVPPEQVDAACPRLLQELLRMPPDALEAEGTIDDGTLQGCERSGTLETPEGPVATYAAALFHEGLPILVTGSVGADDFAAWRPRFAQAARSLRITR